MFKWSVKSQDEAVIKNICNELKLDPLMARLLYNRGLYNKEQIENFLNVNINNLYSPFLLNDMEFSCKRIEKALETGEKITIYGDYDVDGISSVVILYKYLIKRKAVVDYYIPDRTDEGYGLNNQALLKIKESGTSLIITVDTGTTAMSEVEYAKSINLDIIITDHHECKEDIPDCPVINPKRIDSQYPFKDLAGVGVVFKLLCALDGDKQNVFNLYGDLVCIGTVADIMPLIDENRILVFFGLKQLENKPATGIKALLEAAGSTVKSVNTATIAYQIAPRINAAGRIGNPRDSVELLLSSNNDKAAELALLLCEENRQRQQKEAEILNDVELMLTTHAIDNIIIEGSDKWHHGVIGIVASKLVERYCRPCILVCFDGENAKGSVRSIKGINIFELLQKSSANLLKFGGHEMAAGLTLSKDKYNDFVKDITEQANKLITESMMVSVIDIECELKCSDLNLNTYDKIKTMEPFGIGNPTPLFVINGLKVKYINSVSSGKHLKISLACGEDEIQAMYFGKTLPEFNCTIGDQVNIICSLNDNIFRNERSLTVNIKNLQLSEDIQEKDLYYNNIFEAYIKNKEDFLFTDDVKISKTETAVLYKYLNQQQNAQIKSNNPFALARRIENLTGKPFNYCKLMFCLKVLEDLNLVDITYGKTLEIDLKQWSVKVDMQKSKIWNLAAVKE
ncbi:MAG: exonuclease RecJ [Clostridia bacterium]|nr:exonuclease RecJ [Clostridia bacterium]